MYQPVGIFSRAMLPGAIGCRKMAFYRYSVLEGLAAMELRTVIEDNSWESPFVQNDGRYVDVSRFFMA